MRFAFLLAKLNLKRLGRRLFLLLAAAAAFAVLSMPLTLGVESLFARGGVRGISIAVCGKDGEGEALAQFAGNLAGVSDYCEFVAVELDEALEMLSRGDITAALELPPDFVDGILSGRNEAPIVHIEASRPLESMLTIYAGQCAADMLSAAQGGIYAVLAALDEQGLRNPDSLLDVNLEYIGFALSRGDMYDIEELSPTGRLGLGQHYTLSAMAWLLMTSGAALYPVLGTRQDKWINRLRAVGCTGAQWALGALMPVLLAMGILSTALCVGFGELSVLGTAGCALFSAGLASAFGALCRSESTAASLAFVCATATAFFSGGIVPPMLMPEQMRAGELYSVASALRDGINGEGGLMLCAAGAALMAAAFVVLSRRYERGKWA